MNNKQLLLNKQVKPDCRPKKDALRNSIEIYEATEQK